VKIEGYFLKLVPKINEIIKNKMFKGKILETFEERTENMLKKINQNTMKKYYRADVEKYS